MAAVERIFAACTSENGRPLTPMRVGILDA
jgi:hypothetical protein